MIFADTIVNSNVNWNSTKGKANLHRIEVTRNIACWGGFAFRLSIPTSIDPAVAVYRVARPVSASASGDHNTNTMLQLSLHCRHHHESHEFAYTITSHHTQWQNQFLSVCDPTLPDIKVSEFMLFLGNPRLNFMCIIVFVQPHQLRPNPSLGG